jgi:hypothetical protein
MVRKVSDNGGIYHEPPYTEAEEEDFYRRTGSIVGVLKSDRRSPPAEPPQKSPLQRSAK